MKQEQADRMEAILREIRDNQAGLKERVAKIETQAGYFQLTLGFVLTAGSSFAYYVASIMAKKGFWP